MPAILITPTDYRRLERLVDQLAASARLDEARIQALDDELARAQIVDESRLPPDVVTMETEVDVVDVDTAERLRICVVFPQAADVDQGRISILAPVGLAVLGMREGDEFTWKTPSRVRKLRIERVIHQPEANGARP